MTYIREGKDDFSLLAIETTGRTLSVALARREKRAAQAGSGAYPDSGGVSVKTGRSNRSIYITERKSPGELNHLTGLVPMIKDLLADEDAPLSSINAIAVSSGPGSFTGIRIGVSAARALAQVSGLPVVKVPTLETFVYLFDAAHIVCPVFDARRSQVYAGAFRLVGVGAGAGADKGCAADADGGAGHSDGAADGGIIERIISGGVFPPDEYFGLLARTARGFENDIVFCGDGIGLFRDYAAAAGGVITEQLQTAAAVARWAMDFGELRDYLELEPIYMRKAEAQRKLEERLALSAPVQNSAKDPART